MEETKDEMDDPNTPDNREQSQSPGVKEYSCGRCSKSFTTKKYLRSHLKTIHESPRLFICPLCGKQLAREKGLNQHVRTIHEGNWSVFCSLCGKGFINRCRLKKHCINVHERSSRFPCPICDKGFTSDSYRTHHMELVHYGHGNEREAKAKHQVSPFCPETPMSDFASNNQSPIETQPSSSDDQPLDLSMHKCRAEMPDHCLTEATNRNSYEQLQQSSSEVSSTSRSPVPTMTGQKPSADDNCLTKEVKGGRHNCTYCEKSFASKEYLRLHEATVHEGTKAFICSACGKHFSVHQALRKHYIIQHEGGKPYRCRDCKMEFRTRATLRSHRSMTHGFRAQPANVISTLLLFFSPRHQFLRKYNFIPDKNATANFLLHTKLQHFAA
ncbi:hypothetical protein T265_03999 [Opisthorchis viverrini]|uniref:C2H2-type domain-containing protein n=2 Tax=Opisthorchis viverrini TaxID=6198 RepID=A0A074ZQF2_OPIVI|nr:hypothetical protein T265_03999 [Opisthorchis viverrini]KER29336.1 hypothetical protein T265_03999 [Opisthorchis viverrini]